MKEMTTTESATVADRENFEVFLFEGSPKLVPVGYAVYDVRAEHQEVPIGYLLSQLDEIRIVTAKPLAEYKRLTSIYLEECWESNQVDGGFTEAKEEVLVGDLRNAFGRLAEIQYKDNDAPTCIVEKASSRRFDVYTLRWM